MLDPRSWVRRFKSRAGTVEEYYKRYRLRPRNGPSVILVRNITLESRHELGETFQYQRVCKKTTGQILMGAFFGPPSTCETISLAVLIFNVSFTPVLTYEIYDWI